jgi:aspartyl-tRNA(Asn)/glutamyl-tRNA(Gln) amidotransferase subunit A
MTDWTIISLGEAIRKRQISPVEIVEECLARIDRLDSTLRAFITVDSAGARTAAATLTAELAAGRSRGPLHGVPMAFKDLCATRGLPTSCGTKTPEYFVATDECSAVRRLRRAGAVTLGKLNMTELALGPFGDNAHHGDVQNPWRLGHCAGGSSSGSAAAVAAGLALGALGSDTGGSIRLPAACCGIVGLKPTYGRVSRAGVMPLSWSLDHIGPMARTVHDTARVLSVIAGRDDADATASRRVVPDYAGGLSAGVAGLRVGLPENYYFEDVAATVAGAVHEAARVLESQGATLVALSLPDPRPLTDLANIIARAESAAVHARLLKEHPHELQPAVRARLEVGLSISAHDYLQASRLRARLTRTFIREVFGPVDVLMTPVIPEPAPALEAVKAGSVEEIVTRMGRFSRLTRPFNALGLPALSVPCGFSPSGLPLAAQIVGRPFDEATVLGAGHVYERATAWWVRRPAFTA